MTDVTTRAPNMPGEASPPFLAGGGETGALLRAKDWPGNPLGPPEAWPPMLRMLVAIMLDARQAMFVAWGPQRIMLYNDAYADICGARHPAALGQTFREVWFDVMHEVGPILERAFAGISTHMDDIAFTLHRNGYPEEAHFSFSYTPVRDEAGQVAGMFCACTETTGKVFADRRQAVLLALEERLRGSIDPNETKAVATEMLGRALGASCVGYAETDATADHVRIERPWTAPGAISVAGTHRLAAYGPPMIPALRAGRLVPVDDVLANPLTEGAAEAFAAIGCRALVNAPLVKDGRLCAVLFVLHQAPRRWAAHELALIAEVAERCWAAVERARAETALRESEERLRLIVEGARDYAIFMTDATDRIETWLPGAVRIFGWTEAEAIGQPADLIFTPEDRAAGVPRREFEAARRDGRAPDVRWHLRKDGTRVFIEGAVTALHGPDGVLRGFLKIGQDVTARRASEERQALLAREVDHRAKNALAVVQSMVRLTRAADLPSFVRAVEGRIAALARAQTLLAEESWDGADLHALLTGELTAFLGERRAELDGPPVVLPPGTTQPIAMTIHELATNATKHGALSRPEGRVAIGWDVAAGAPATLRLRWVESGGPPVLGPPQRHGFGTRVVDSTIHSQLGGAVTLDWRPEGLVCDIHVPLRWGAPAIP